MGITGLLPLLEKATRPCQISEFRGGTVAVDTYCLLHKGVIRCAEQLALGQETDLYVKYCLNYVKMLLKYNIHPIMVFDGSNLPAKAGTELKRRDNRKKAKQRATELLRLGRSEEAGVFFRQCVDVTPQMALAVIKECRKLKVDCIVAPYESDAQLAFFNLKGVADVIITEDSDLLLFGCKKVMYKMDSNGCGYLVEAEHIPKALKLRPEQYSFEKFRYICVLSGCDYLPSLQGIGLKKALKFMTLTAETDPRKFLDKLPAYLNMRHLQITDEYKENFLIANATFCYQTVFDPFECKLKPLNELDDNNLCSKYIRNSGDIYDNEKALQVALGNLHPRTFEVLDDWTPPKIIQGFSKSIWAGQYFKKSTREMKDKKAVANNQIEKSEFKIENIEEINNIKRFEDDQLINEYKNYITATSTTTVQSNDDDEREKTESVAEEQKLSPVLGNKKAFNPFVKSKKISNFPLTNTSSCSEVIVKSKYFFKTEEVKNESQCVFTSKICEENLVDVKEENMDIEEVDFNEIDEKCDKKRLLVKEEVQEQENTTKFNVVEEQEIKKMKFSSCSTVCSKKAKGKQKTLKDFFSKV